ncbi:MAG: ADP-ribose pyrophosphatase [Candidatus Parabeggiatoa sp. nov. 1]|nr:MAG: ADP-ribose pyrophosphatase [Gammaproteobacteria bacterium]
MESQWLKWAKKLQAISQNGLMFAENPYDIERYQAIREIALEIMAEGAKADITKLRDIFSQEIGYATPKVDVRGVVFRDDALLFVKERMDGCWALPGGWADVVDTPSNAVTREIYEESGYQTRVVKLLAVYDRSKQGHRPEYPYHVYKLFFLCELQGGSATTSIETEEVAFFRENEIPELSKRRVTLAQIKRMFEYSRHPEWQTDYD